MNDNYKKFGFIFLGISVAFFIGAAVQVYKMHLDTADLFTLAANYKDYAKSMYYAFLCGSFGIVFGWFGIHIIR